MITERPTLLSESAARTSRPPPPPASQVLLADSLVEAIAAHGGGVGAAGAGMSPLIQRVASQFAGHERRSEVHKLYKKYGERYGLVDRLMEQTAEAIENNGQWLHKNKAPLCAWVAAKAGGG